MRFLTISSTTGEINGKEYIINYPNELKGKSKRNMTEEEKRAAQENSMLTKAKRAKEAKIGGKLI